MSAAGKGVLNDRGFVVCALILAISAASIAYVTKTLKWNLRKLPVPLRKSFADFNDAGLYPYRVVQKVKIDAEVEEALGTKEYIQYFIEDPDVSEREGGRYVNFFVTYYTGNPDQVPHVPEVCYVGGGNIIEDQDILTIHVPGVGLPDDALRVQLLMFKATDRNTGMDVTKPVLYFFSVNGKYTYDRKGTRWALSNIRDRYAYFSKVEIAFIGSVQPDRERAIALTEKFLAKALPILVNENWPDWPEVMRQANEHATDVQATNDAPTQK
jgi:hypothetical protein